MVKCILKLQNKKGAKSDLILSSAHRTSRLTAKRSKLLDMLNALRAPKRDAASRISQIRAHLSTFVAWTSATITPNVSHPNTPDLPVTVLEARQRAGPDHSAKWKVTFFILNKFDLRETVIQRIIIYSVWCLNVSRLNVTIFFLNVTIVEKFSKIDC